MLVNQVRHLFTTSPRTVNTDIVATDKGFYTCKPPDP